MGNLLSTQSTPAEGAIKVVIEGEEGHRASIVANRVSAQATNNNDNALMLVREDISKLKTKFTYTILLVVSVYCWYFWLMGINSCIKNDSSITI